MSQRTRCNIYVKEIGGEDERGFFQSLGCVPVV